MNSTLLYIGSALPFIWGVSHLLPTRKVVQGFGEISSNNRRIIAMEWITEGGSLIFVGVLTALITYIDHDSSVSRAIYWTIFIFLNILSLISLFTGFRVSLLPFKLCPFIFSGSSLLILLGILIT
jgi:hypothetical protein